jgi:hypothetical protein
MARRSEPLKDNLLDLPVATITHLLFVLAFCVVFVVNGGHFTDDLRDFFAVALGANGLVAVGRGLAARKAG